MNNSYNKLSAAGGSQHAAAMSTSDHRGLNQTMGSQTSNNNTANLKGKLQALEEMIL